MIGSVLSCSQDVNRSHKDVEVPRKYGENVNPSYEHGLEIEALRDRLSRLSEASLRINESLDLDTVLQEVVDSARALTDSHYGAITTLDDSGLPHEFVTSGMTPEDHRALENHLPDGPLIYKYLSSLREPLRIRNYRGYIGALGLSDFLPFSDSSFSFLTAPIRHAGRTVGNIYLAKEEPPKGERNKEEPAKEERDHVFSLEDEEILVMFASQSALVIANARRYRDEQRARADLEALINTSPVGVAVFDGRTGAPVSFNLEAVRIVGGLQPPGQPLEHLLEVVTVRRQDGREISLAEFPLAQVLKTGETVRAEEIVIEMPDGRSVTTLVNATPIYSEESGELDSVVVTLQDMTPLEDLERLRAEFLAMVSHELRTPLAAIRGCATTMLDEGSALDPAEMRQFHRIIVEQADRMRVLISDLLDVARIETGTLSVSPVPAGVGILVDEARSAFMNADGRHTIRIELGPDLPLVMADSRRIVQVLSNLLSNAARHSPEASVIRLSVLRKNVQVEISVTDDGRGIPADRMAVLFRKFSQVEPEDNGGDTGLGLAVCKGIVEAHGGRIWAESEGPGLGSRFTFTLSAVEGSASVGPEATPSRTSSAPGQDEDRPRILVVDDDPQTLRYVRDVLSKAGYWPIVTADPEEVPRLMEDEEPRLVLLDLMLPGTDGIIVMKSIQDVADVPIIFLSAYGQDQVIARAFEMGAADYVVKPFSPTELVARIRAALRRPPAAPRRPSQDFRQPGREPYEFGEMVIDFERRTTTLGGLRLKLTPTEYRVLAELAANASRVLTHEELLRRIWRNNRTGDSGPVRTIIKRLRRKLDDDAATPTYIHTEPRVGYFMPAPDSADGDGQQWVRRADLR